MTGAPNDEQREAMIGRYGQRRARLGGRTTTRGAPPRALIYAVSMASTPREETLWTLTNMTNAASTRPKGFPDTSDDCGRVTLQLPSGKDPHIHGHCP